MTAALRLASNGDTSTPSGVKTLANYGPEVFDERELQGYTTVGDHRGIWRREVIPWKCSNWPLASISTGDVRRWLTKLSSKGHSTSTVKNCLGAMRTVFTAALQDCLVETHPCNGLVVNDKGSTEETSTFLSRHELESLVDAAGSPDGLLIAIAAGTGIRQGEMRALLVEDVHLGSKPRIVVRYGSPGKSTKSGKIRTVPLFGLALEALKVWMEIRPQSDRRLVFPRPNGSPRARGRMVHPVAWAAWLKTAGIRRHVRWHDLRHTCATLLLQGAWGEPWSLEEVKEMLGHTSLRVTERYAKATGSLADKAAADKIGPRRNSEKGLAPRQGTRSATHELKTSSGLTADHCRALEDAERAAREYLQLVASGERHAHAKGLELCGRVNVLIDELRGRQDDE